MYGHFAVNYRVLQINVKIYGQKLEIAFKVEPDALFISLRSKAKDSRNYLSWCCSSLSNVLYL